MKNNQDWHEPVLTSILRNRGICVLLTIAAVLQTLLTYFRLPAWQCPFRTQLNCPCPGCGLTRGVLAFLSGDIRTSVTYHLFSPFLLVALCLVGFAALLPTSPRTSLIEIVLQFETRTQITKVLLILLVVYWGIRIILFQDLFYSIIMQ